MKVILKISFITLLIGCSVFVLGGCGNNMSTASNVKVAVVPGLRYPTLFEFKSDGTINICTGNIAIFDIRDTDYADRITETKTIVLSDDDKNDIVSLIKALEKSESYEGTHPPISLDGDEIQAVIGGKLYRSMYQPNYYDPDPKSVNTSLLDLTYKLIELSPIEVGVEMPKMK